MTDENASLIAFDGLVQSFQDLCTSEIEAGQILDEGRPLINQLYQGFQCWLAGTAIASNDLGAAQRSVTEVHRLLRLLQTDIALYHTARTSILQQQRLQTLRDHANQLTHYWQALRLA